MANGFERGRELFLFFREDAIRGEPIIEPQIRHSLRETRTNAAKQHCHSARSHVMQKVVEAFESNHVGIACAFKAQHDMTNVFLDRTLL